MADFNGDGRADLAFGNLGLNNKYDVSPETPAVLFASIHPEKSFVAILRNDGAGGFETLWPWDTGLVFETGQPRRLAWEDMTGDGFEDLVVSANEGPLYLFELIRE